MQKTVSNTSKGPSRRKLLQASAAGMLAGVAALNRPGRSSAFAAEKRDGKILVAYFSRTGNTRDVANQIHQRVGGDIVEIQTAHSYPSDYRATTEQAKREQESNFRPQLTTEIENMDAYDILFIGYPNWWSTLPMAFFSFFEKYTFDHKTLVPFCTHEGSYLGRSVSDMTALCPTSLILEGLALRGGNGGYAKTDPAHREIADWLIKLKI